MAQITSRRRPGSRTGFEHYVEWVDNDGEIHERCFDTHREAVEFVIETEGALLEEAFELFDAFMSARTQGRARVRLIWSNTYKRDGSPS